MGAESGRMWRPWFLVAVGAPLYANSLSAPFIFDDLDWIRHDRLGATGEVQRIRAQLEHYRADAANSASP